MTVIFYESRPYPPFVDAAINTTSLTNTPVTILNMPVLLQLLSLIPLYLFSLALSFTVVTTSNLRQKD